MPNKNNPHTEDRVTSRGLHRYADDFFQAYTLITSQRNNAVQVRYYLLCHSFELSMKAMLREAGYSVKQLQKFGHDLEKIADELEKNSKTKVYWNPEDKEMIKIANTHYVTKEMEYFTRGEKVLVDPDQFSNFLGFWLRVSHVSIIEIAKAEGRPFPSI
ncbi:MAG: hypothetical protein US25_C0052G0002 [Candidatus Moranbacteria bacterium GW2011_GWE1_36_7]|nr:MAG: hypothetical protein UR99_C0057G0002 [Candidatus Moranbacteria bacterium GW2011_GWD2_36_12]KKQ04632.1 MAG: hypothetical protein US16_C0052G0002 [Candidatus Moranbacteria bacterium GW2011_GWE2_36_40]KKQ12354.1 MAG: hypothetical protein US25_C0052G0002 [Candidatus Moranbacteria bacterium GW2011_GWE1_36_7]